MTAQGWFDTDGRQVEQKAIGAEDEDGKTLDLVPSTLGVEQALEGPVDAREVLDLSLTAVYRMAPENLDDALAASLAGGTFWRFPFNYLVGAPAATTFLGAHAPPPPAEDDEDGGDLDFEMM